ncbi:hypothetical protein VNO77_35469 [Canavalia gladiata]|uniref:Photosystem I assembly factor PSA3, chloroplastic n=1 Tax=Canavalia gladiata TaxID=3824 RepID=A0AAN9KF75_CANGL
MVVLKSTSTLTSLLFLRHRVVLHPTRLYSNSTSRVAQFSVRAYIENPNSFGSLASKVIGALPVVGLIARIFSDEGGVGDDLVDFAEFRRRVGKNCSNTDTSAFYEFQDRRGRAGDPLYVLLCCWLAAIGAGLLKTEDLMEGVARLRLSNDIEFEEQNFMALMNEAKERRAKLKAEPRAIPMEIRVEKAIDAIYVCCFGKDPVEEEDDRLLTAMLSAVFPTVQREEIQRLIKNKAEKVAAGVDEDYVPEPESQSKEALELQMKDLQFLKQNSDT